MDLKTGSVVYRVIEIDPPEEGALHTWHVEARVVERASPRQIKLEKPFSGTWRTQWAPDAPGRYFFETPLQAIQHFLAAQRLAIDTCERKKKDAERAISWATSQEGTSPG